MLTMNEKDKCLELLDTLITQMTSVDTQDSRDYTALLVSMGATVRLYGPLSENAKEVKETLDLAELLTPGGVCKIVPLYGKGSYVKHMLENARALRDILTAENP